MHAQSHVLHSVLDISLFSITVSTDQYSSVSAKSIVFFKIHGKKLTLFSSWPRHLPLLSDCTSSCKGAYRGSCFWYSSLCFHLGLFQIGKEVNNHVAFETREKREKQNASGIQNVKKGNFRLKKKIKKKTQTGHLKFHLRKCCGLIQLSYTRNCIFTPTELPETFTSKVKPA